MGLLPWSFGFLLLITILAWSFQGRMAEETMVTGTIVGVVRREAYELTDKIAKKSKAAYNRICEKNGETPQDDDDDDEEEEEQKPVRRVRGRKAHHRLTSKLHISSLFTPTPGPQKDTQEKIFRNLLRELYGSQPLFTPQGNDDPYVQQLFDEVRAKAVEWGPKFPVHKAAALANIELEGSGKDQKQFVLFLILKGGEGEIFRGSKCTVLPLLRYISALNKDVCMTPYLAPIPLLLALFQNKEVVERVLEFRKYARVRMEKDDEQSMGIALDDKKEDIIDILSEEFKTQFEPLLPPGIDAQYIDFHVSRTRANDY